MFYFGAIMQDLRRQLWRIDSEIIRPVFTYVLSNLANRSNAEATYVQNSM